MRQEHGYTLEEPADLANLSDLYDFLIRPLCTAIEAAEFSRTAVRANFDCKPRDNLVSVPLAGTLMSHLCCGTVGVLFSGSLLSLYSRIVSDIGALFTELVGLVPGVSNALA